MTASQAVAGALAVGLPLTVEDATLAAVGPPVTDGEGAVRVTLELRTPYHQTRADALLVPAGADPARLEAYLEAWLAVLPRLLASPDVDQLQAFDLVAPDVLGCMELATAADFERALRSPFRLGALEPEPEPDASAAPGTPLDLELEVHRWLARRLPLNEPPLAVLAEPVDRDGRLVRRTAEGLGVRLRARLVTARDDGALAPYERSGEVLLVPDAALADPGRVARFLSAWLGRLTWVLTAFDWRRPEVEVGALVFPTVALADEDAEAFAFRVDRELTGLVSHERRVRHDSRWLALRRV